MKLIHLQGVFSASSINFRHLLNYMYLHVLIFASGSLSNEKLQLSIMVKIHHDRIKKLIFN